MAAKRRRPSPQNEKGPSKAKRGKFTLDHARLPEITTEGVVLVTGGGDFGQLGLGPDVTEKTRPAVVELSEEIVDVCAGGVHTVCLTKDGKVLTFGCNDEGALGRVTENNEEAEFKSGEVELPGKVIQVSAGDSHTAALLDDGRVFAWGTFRDSHGNMGMTLRGNEKLPFEIIKGIHIIKIASGADHIVFLTNHGEVWTCGCAEQGQLGRTTERSSNRNARSGVGKGQIAKLLQPSPISLKPTLKLHFDNIWAGTYTTYAKVADKDDIYVCGLNNYHQLALPQMNVPVFTPTLSKDFSKYKWNIITSGQHHTLGLTDDNKVYCIGRKDYGRLGLGENCNEASELTLIPTFENKCVTDISAGASTSHAITSEGELYSWGMGSGQLGTGAEDDCFVPTLIKSKQLTERKAFRVSAGGQHTVILAVSQNNNDKGDNDKGDK